MTTVEMNGHTGDAKKLKEGSELEMFDAVFPQLVTDLTAAGMRDPQLADAMKWFKQVLEYNVPFGKKNRGLTVVQSYKYLVGDEARPEDIRRAQVLGWCVEILQAFFLVADDIMDASETRRGQPCWYKRTEVGLIAVNDALYLDTVIYALLKQYIRDQPYYVDIIELFHETTLQTVIGQNLDTCTPPRTGVDFTNYTPERYSAIVIWKTAYYSFYLPVALAMNMANIKDTTSHDCAKEILLKMGEFFQIQDDYLDCYGDVSVTGKVGTDIQDNKCSWLVVQALRLATPEQRQVIQDNYAQWDEDKVQKVKDIFNDLNLRQVYADYEESSYSELNALIDAISVQQLPKEMFRAYGRKIYKRQK